MARLLRPVTKIISVIPAAAASSTAYWISGLSTIGSISFGLALVTGRNRLPKPATGNTAFLSLGMESKLLQQFVEARLVEHRHAQLARLVELRAGVRPGDHEVGAARHRAGNLVPLRLDGGTRLVARHACQGAGEDEGPDCGRAARRARRFQQNVLLEATDDIAVVRLVQEFGEAVHELGADALQGHFAGRLPALLPLRIVLANRFLVCRGRGPVGLQKGIQRAEMPRQDLR